MSSRNISRCFLLSAWRDIEVVVDVGLPFRISDLSVFVAVATQTFVATNLIIITTGTRNTCTILLVFGTTELAWSFSDNLTFQHSPPHPTLRPWA